VLDELLDGYLVPVGKRGLGSGARFGCWRIGWLGAECRFSRLFGVVYTDNFPDKLQQSRLVFLILGFFTELEEASACLFLAN
jgi:hypothetical protein